MKKIAIYSTPTCHFCHDVKEFFKANNLPYDEYDVQVDVARREEMVQKTGKMAVPVISVTNEAGQEDVMVGFDEPKLRQLLGL